MNTETKVRFTAVCEFEVEVDEAIDIFTNREEKRGDALGFLLTQKHPTLKHSYNVDDLANGLGRALAAQRIEERRMLTAPKEVAVPMEEVA